MVLLTARMKSKNIEEMALKYPVVLACEYIEGSAIPTVSINNISGAQKQQNIWLSWDIKE